MDYYDEEFESAYKPQYEIVDERAQPLVDLAIVVLGIAAIMELIKIIF